MAEAYIVDALRSPTGKRNGALAAVHGADLGAHVHHGAWSSATRFPPTTTTTSSSAASTPSARWPATSRAPRGWPPACRSCVPGTTVDRQCGSSQQAVHFAAQAVMSGTQDVVLAGGVQTMSSIPISSAMLAGRPLGFSTPFAESLGWQARFGDAPVNQFYAAQRIADHWDISRAEMEVFALESHDRALRAIAKGRFEREIVPLPDLLAMDETARDSTLEKMATLAAGRPGLSKHHGRGLQFDLRRRRCRAGGVGSGAQALRPDAARAHPPPQRVRADDPIWHLTAPIAATPHALQAPA